MKKNNGFTLIELLAVILVLGIIALVAIPVISKTINTARKSSFKTSVVNSFKTLDYALYKKNSNTIPESGIDVSELNLKSDFIGGKFKIIDGKETAFYIRNKSFCAYGTMKDLRITESCESMDLTNPIVDNTKFIVSNIEHNIKVTLSEGIANDPDSGIDKYVINLYEGDKLIKSQEKKNIGETTFDNLKSSCVYTIELIVYNYAGGANISHKNIKSSVTDIPNITISDSDVWSKTKTVTLVYDTEKYNCEYSLDDAQTWNIYSNPFSISSNLTINARLIDKDISTSIGNTNNKVVTKIDKLKPIISLSKSKNVITLTLSDNETGVSAYCIKTTSGISNCSWVNFTNISSTTKTYTATDAGTYYAYAKDNADNISDVSSISISNSEACSYSVGQTWNYSSYGSSTFTVPCNAKYKLEVWGAQGGGSEISGNGDSGSGARGGYSYGTLNVSKSTYLYVYVGNYGSSATSGLASGGYNGGGSGYASSSGEPGNGGGGATDIRIASTSLYARVIVAGGGGGGGEDPSDPQGVGGGLSGTGYSEYDASQTSAGSGGSFGYGGSTNYADGGGGGGGWYGGGTSSSSSTGTDSQGGGGGSGYIYTSSYASNYPSGCLLNSSYYLTNANTYAGNQSFISPSGSTETGHTRTGYARITLESFN